MGQALQLLSGGSTDHRASQSGPGSRPQPLAKGGDVKGRKKKREGALAQKQIYEEKTEPHYSINKGEKSVRGREKGKKI